MYQQQGYMNAAQQSQTFGQPVQSQYRGLQKSFQPTGYVQSVYGQNQGQQSFGFAGTYSQQASTPGAYHTASYRGDQQGHDQYLRADSIQPNSYASSFGQTTSFQPTQSFSSFGTGAYGMNAGIGQNVAQTAGIGNQFQGTQSYHTASYRGDQQGHDQQWRSDSQSPGQSAYATSSFGAASGIGASYQNQFQNQVQSPSFGTTAAPYHTASYRGNQQGHDQYQRADSTQPSSIGMSAGAFVR